MKSSTGTDPVVSDATPPPEGAAPRPEVPSGPAPVRQLLHGAPRDGDSEWRRVSDGLLRVLEEERHRISEHLNSDIAPLIISVKLLVENALHRLGEGTVEETARILEDVPQRLRSLVEDLRTMANDLRPQLLEERGLLATLEWLSDAFAESYPGIGLVRRLTAGESDVPEILRLDIFRIAQEALRNVGENSGASWVRLGLYLEGDSLVFLVEDNGVGFVGAKFDGSPTSRMALGLAIIRRRVETTGGRLTLKSLARQGTQLRIQWPLAPGS